MTTTIAYERPWVYEKQRDAIFGDTRYAICEASTKTGKTAGCLIWLFEQAISGRGNGQNYWWVAPVFKQSRMAYRRLKRMIPKSLFTSNESELTITLANGAVIWFMSASDPDNLYGEDVYACVIDEATRMKEDAWFAVRSTLTATGGPCRIIGNVKGRKNWCYKLARKAEAGEPNWHYSKLTVADAVEAGIFPQEEMDDARRVLPHAVFRELYYAEPSDDGGNPFGIEAIRKCVAPLRDTVPVAFGWDLAKSIDWTVGIGLDDNGDTCRYDRFQLPWRATTERIRGRTAGVYALVDSTGVGDPILEELQADMSGRWEGFKFTPASKQQLMEGLAVAIQQREITFPEDLVGELECFEYEYTRTGVRYSAPEGMHDDKVCSLALAVKKWKERRGREIEGDLMA